MSISCNQIYCTTANPIEVIFVETEQGRTNLGVVDGFRSKGVEAETDIEDRKQFLRKIGYKDLAYISSSHTLCNNIP